MMIYYGILIMTILIFELSAEILSKYKRWIKYIPGAISLLFGLINLYIALNGRGIVLITHVALAIICIAGFVSGICTALVIDFIIPKIKKRNI